MPDRIPQLLDVFEDGIYIIDDDYLIEYMNKRKVNQGEL